MLKVCYNFSRCIMERKQVKIYTNFNGIEQNEVFLAIKNDFVIKYIDLDNNKMVIDVLNNIIKRENSDYLMELFFENNIIEITIKKMQIKLKKEIKTLLIKKNKSEYLVRYQLIDEKEINEYYVNF